jgi:hypothetical protein
LAEVSRRLDARGLMVKRDVADATLIAAEPPDRGVMGRLGRLQQAARCAGTAAGLSEFGPPRRVIAGRQAAEFPETPSSVKIIVHEEPESETRGFR